MIEPKSCNISFERRPVWLWTLRPAEWDSISMLESDATRLLETYCSTWDRFASRVKTVSSWVPNSDSHLADVWWISGSEAYAASVLRIRMDVPHAIWRHDAGRRTPMSTEACRWYSINHMSVGGPTNARATFGVAGFDVISLPRDLPRTLAHVVKHSVHATPCPAVLTEPHYTVHDRLRLGLTHLPILFETHFSRTGWGQRGLVDCELAAAFEVPEFVDWEPAMVTEMAPLQLFRAIMDAILEQLTPRTSVGKR